MTTILLLHGHGDDPATFADLTEQLRSTLDAVVVVPRGEVAVAGGGYAWWPDDASGPDDETLRALRAEHGEVDVVVGHSQGAALALRLGLGRRIVVAAGFLAGGEPTVTQATSVLVVHGEDDETVDPLHGRLVARRCRAAGALVEERWHDGGHAWTPTVAAVVVGWLATPPA